jgi:hypothetical protein
VLRAAGAKIRRFNAVHGLLSSGPMQNRIQSLLGVQYPVVQAPMTYIARAELAAAVSDGGGMGMIETLTADGRADLLRVRELTDRPVAANLMIQGWKKDPSIVDVLAAAEVRHVFTSAGDPALFTDRLHDAGMTVFPVVGSLKGALKAVAAGVDALVVEGVEGGGFSARSNVNGATSRVNSPGSRAAAGRRRRRREPQGRPRDRRHRRGRWPDPRCVRRTYPSGPRRCGSRTCR